MSKLFLFVVFLGVGKIIIVWYFFECYDYLFFFILVIIWLKWLYEMDGKDYYFIFLKQFMELVKSEGFVEWEEVYEGLFYGIFKSEVEWLWGKGKYIVFDIDVKGVVNIKEVYFEEVIVVFVKFFLFEVLCQWLVVCGIEDEFNFCKWLDRVVEEMIYEGCFDIVFINDDL